MFLRSKNQKYSVFIVENFSILTKKKARKKAAKVASRNDASTKKCSEESWYYNKDIICTDEMNKNSACILQCSGNQDFDEKYFQRICGCEDGVCSWNNPEVKNRLLILVNPLVPACTKINLFGLSLKILLGCF